MLPYNENTKYISLSLSFSLYHYIHYDKVGFDDDIYFYKLLLLLIL